MCWKRHCSRGSGTGVREGNGRLHVAKSHYIHVGDCLEGGTEVTGVCSQEGGSLARPHHLLSGFLFEI